MCLTPYRNIPHDQLNQKSIDLTDIGLENICDTCDYIKLEDVSTLNVTERDLLFLQLNIRGLISKQSDISKLIQNCTNSEKKIDVVLLCETWVTNTTKNLIRIPGYNYVGLERSEK